VKLAQIVVAAAIALLTQPMLALAGQRLVMTWVPPYALDPSWEQLNKTYGGAGPKNALSHLGLQFWVPTADGGLARANRYGEISNADIKRFRKWGDKHGVKVLLTVFNGEWGWDWALARQAFGPGRKAFVSALLEEIQARRLDGIDVDLEATEITGTEEDRRNFAAFIRELGAELKARDKDLIVDSFSYIWNAPNIDWWPDLFPHVTGIVSMGYADIGRAPPDGSGLWQSYAWQRAAAGEWAERLLLGMPSWVDTWQGDTAAAQIDWALPKKRKVGVAIWDAQMSSPGWQVEPVWQRLRELREQGAEKKVAGP
jgi:hypothetical protein